eukprot:TRINITY_DN23427_c0_g1_i1.p1 TRINITY_DN23427_c0_g1~~TRINITY_DN23427_c0_g1_i1.p1  ORF type:complete len:153 (+),score=27.05 TRINITY_DN23427_c0_g1_i1:84-542(+)
MASPTSEAQGSGSSSEPVLVSEQSVANRWNQLRSEIQQFHSKITELELELSEHSLVVNALEPMEPSRRCFRQIGGVLVERTVAEVLPAVKRNRQGIEEVIQRLTENLESKKKDLINLEQKYNIKIRRAGEADSPARGAAGSPQQQGQGVLVQ